MAVELTCDELSTLEVLVDMERADRLRWCIANGEQEKNDDQHTETHYQRNYYCAAWRGIVVSYHRTGVRRNN